MKLFLRFVFCIYICLLPSYICHAQGCCSGGSGSPIAGGASQGVLLDRQMEVASSFQYIHSNNFLTKDKDTISLFDHFDSRYIYSKIAYGVTKDFTFSVESGYYLNKTSVGLRDSITGIPIDSFRLKGFADLILFPRYDVINHTAENKRVELTLGLGYKLPLRSGSDTAFLFHDSLNNIDRYTLAPPIVQPTTGSQDFIFYSFFFRGFPDNNFRLFANGIYIRRGWNPLGFKFGDYASVGVFASKTFLKKLGITLQLKGEWSDSLRYRKDNSWVGWYVYPSSTGSKRISLAPQMSFSYKNFTFFALKDFTLYEYVNGVQMKTQTVFTTGISYRFFTARSVIPKNSDEYYSCSMNCEGGSDTKPGNCRVCGMKMEKKK